MTKQRKELKEKIASAIKNNRAKPSNKAQASIIKLREELKVLDAEIRAGAKLITKKVAPTKKESIKKKVTKKTTKRKVTKKKPVKRKVAK